MATAMERKIDTSHTIELIRFRPPRIAWVLLLIGTGLHFWLRDRLEWHFSSNVGGVSLIAGGFAVMMWAWWLFRKGETAIRPTDAASVLVDRGPYRWTRNPMYLGMTAMLGGCAWMLGTVPALVAPLGFFLAMNAVFVPFEERRLSEIFGQQFNAYRRCVRRWL